MKHLIQSIAINTPCQQSWDGMTADVNGKFCASCQKNVIDFSKLTDVESLAILSAADNLCGRFDRIQLSRINQSLTDTKKIYWWRNLKVAALFAGILPFATAYSKPKANIEQHYTLRKNVPLGIDTPATRVIKGNITAKLDGLPLPGAVIYIENRSVKANSDLKGDFQITIPSGVTKLIVSFVGFENTTIQILSKTNTYNAVLNEVFLGEITIRRKPSWFKTKWNFNSGFKW